MTKLSGTNEPGVGEMPTNSAPDVAAWERALAKQANASSRAAMLQTLRR